MNFGTNPPLLGVSRYSQRILDKARADGVDTSSAPQVRAWVAAKAARGEKL